MSEAGEKRTPPMEFRGAATKDVLRADRKQLIQEVNFWTGIDRELPRALIYELLERIQPLELNNRGHFVKP